MGFLGKKSIRKMNRMVKKEIHEVKRMGSKALRGGEMVGTVMRKGGEIMEEVGKAGVVLGGISGNAALAGASAQIVGAGVLAQIGVIDMRKGSKGLRKGDMSKLQESGGQMLQVFA